MRSRYSTEPIPVFGKQKADENVGLAVSGKPVIREGRQVDFTSVVHQFSDMRHLFLLPNFQMR
jgi:hypothetical protein